MNSEAKVSVIIPLYDQKQYVSEAIESVVTQTYPNIELIVVNDGSTDDPYSVLEKYNTKIKLVNQKNRGLAAARNTGIQNSSGDYLQFLDADDCLHPEKIRLQLEFTTKQGATVSYCEIAQYDQNSQHQYINYVGEVKDMFVHLYNFWYIYPVPIHSLLFKRDIFEKFGLFDEKLKACEDRYFLSKLILQGVRFAYFPLIGGVRRKHKYNMNNNKLHIIKNTIKYYKKINRELGDDWFIKKFNYSGYEMTCANLTYIYGDCIANNAGHQTLKIVKKLYKKENIKFNAKPIPLAVKRYKLIFLFAAAYFKKWKKALLTGDNL
ncbi:MAG: glycosyltransferase [Candidatus Omnitrophota bacterium]